MFILGNYVNKHTVAIRCANYLLKKLRVTARLPSRHHRPLTLGKFYLRSFPHFSFSSSARNSIAMSTAPQQDLPTNTQPEPVVSNVLISVCSQPSSETLTPSAYSSLICCQTSTSLVMMFLALQAPPTTPGFLLLKCPPMFPPLFLLRAMQVVTHLC